ncbi:MAG: cupin domain-containing protein [Candidatus Wallbacteria bacterium]|nr:cupin domain-containing protein [Candidatus Wallbacteria bacterium]
MICFHKDYEKIDIGDGILMQVLGPGEKMNVLHWNMQDGSEVKLHQHPEEQFGYVIKGGFKYVMGKETFTLLKGDSYFVPPNMPHSFVAIGATEAIDVFSPVKKEIPKKK